MRQAVHYAHTACLALEAGWSEADALAIAMYDQMTDWATPDHIGPDYWPDAAGHIPIVTQIGEMYGARTILGGDIWEPAWVAVHHWHFGGGIGPYGDAEYRDALDHLAATICAGELAEIGRLIHLAQDYAAHRGYSGYPSERNRRSGDSRRWWSRLGAWIVRRQDLLGHLLRPELDDLSVSRERIIYVSCDLRRILWRRPYQIPEASRAIGLLLEARDDEALAEMCRSLWAQQTGRDMPPYRPPSPASAMWELWCATARRQL